MDIFWRRLWNIVMILIVITWVLWFFGIDIRDVKYIIKDKVSDMKANVNINANSQQQSSVNQSKSQTTALKEDALISKCRQSYDTCKEIFTQKYDASVSLIKIEKFEEYSKAEEFSQTWSGLGGQALFSLINSESNFPLVLIASKVRGFPFSEERDRIMPFVFICNKEGELMNQSKFLFCG